MAPKRPAAAATPGSASDGEAGAARNGRRRRASPSPTPSRSRSRSRSRSKSPPSNLRPSAAAVSSSPTSAGADFAAASDSDADNGAGGGAPSSRRINRERPGPEHLDSDADADAGTDGRVPPPRRRGERSPSFHTDADADSAGRVPSPKRNRERTPRLQSDSDSDSDSDNSAAGAASEEDDAGGDASLLPRARRSSNIKPVSASPMDVPRRAARGSSKRRSKRRQSHYGRPSPEQQKRHPRVWSPKDEITILSALINYRAKKGHLPASIQDTSKLHNQISGRLTADASTTQLSDKVRRLKHKYKLLMTRAENGRDPDLQTDHDRDVYELSKKVWGVRSGDHVGGSRAYEDAGAAESDEEQESDESDEDMENGWERREHTSKKPKTFGFENGNGNAIVTVCRAGHGNGTGRDDTEEGKRMYPYLWEAVEELSKEHPSGPIFRKAFGVLEKSKARAMEEKLRKFRMSEIRQQLHRMDLMKETVGMVLDALEGAF
ncbi:hypothetical protein U9M48_038603 [Paspalum notatum var. saurae]|uniref:Glabrous enhancer-binding protein-like DBD domain-containing protein n=1 Tax=Paspalum notatum var. saurae TaxID=547442 RepID=A0AAQ3UM65_PASNO